MFNNQDSIKCTLSHQVLPVCVHSVVDVVDEVISHCMPGRQNLPRLRLRVDSDPPPIFHCEPKSNRFDVRLSLAAESDDGGKKAASARGKKRPQLTAPEWARFDVELLYESGERVADQTILEHVHNPGRLVLCDGAAVALAFRLTQTSGASPHEGRRFVLRFTPTGIVRAHADVGAVAAAAAASGAGGNDGRRSGYALADAPGTTSPVLVRSKVANLKAAEARQSKQRRRAALVGGPVLLAVVLALASSLGQRLDASGGPDAAAVGGGGWRARRETVLRVARRAHAAGAARDVMIVAGAGTKGVDGAYEPNGMYNGSPQWVKKLRNRSGRLQGRYHLFCLGPPEPWWNLQVETADGAFRPVSYGTLQVKAGAGGSAQSEAPALPPEDGWGGEVYNTAWTGADPGPVVVPLHALLSELEPTAAGGTAGRGSGGAPGMGEEEGETVGAAPRAAGQEQGTKFPGITGVLRERMTRHAWL